MSAYPYLTIESGLGAGNQIQITKDSFVIGRDGSSDYAIPNERISRQHIHIFLYDGRWLLEDLDSKNHTWLRGEKILPRSPILLKEGDHIQIASQSILCFHDPSSTLSDDSRVITEGLWIDTDTGDVFIHNQKIQPKLGKRSFLILLCLYEKSFTPNPTVSLDELVAIGWPNLYGVSDEMIDSEIHRIRKRLKELESKHDFIKAERGKGRRFEQLED